MIAYDGLKTLIDIGLLKQIAEAAGVLNNISTLRFLKAKVGTRKNVLLLFIRAVILYG